MAQTWGFGDASGCFGIILALLGSCDPFLCSHCCFGTDGFEGRGLCTAGRIFLALGAKAFFCIMETGVFEGKHFDPAGRPGPVPLLLPSCLFEFINVASGLLAEVGFCNPTLECIWPFLKTGFLSSWLPWIFLPLLLDGCLLFCCTWADPASWTSAKTPYKFPQ